MKDAAARGFATDPKRYDRGRPSYPDEAVHFLADKLKIGPGCVAADLGAGTGKMTRLLVGLGADVVAVEPVNAMLAEVRATAPSVNALEGTGEALPLETDSVDAAIYAQAFHWVDHSRALAEVARVLRSGGGLALVWNSRDRRVDWVQRLSSIIQWNEGAIPTYDKGDEQWADVLDSSGHFTEAGYAEFAYEHPLDPAGLVDLMGSVSYVANLPEASRAEMLGSVAELAEGLEPRFAMPYRTVVYWCHRN